MLKTLTRLHSPELLHTLASMGHGDELALVDAHFPATSLARRLVRLDGADLPDALAACLYLIPVDTFVPDPAIRMEMIDDPNKIPEVQALCQEVIDKAEGRHVALVGGPTACLLRSSEVGVRHRCYGRDAALWMHPHKEGNHCAGLKQDDGSAGNSHAAIHVAWVIGTGASAANNFSAFSSSHKDCGICKSTYAALRSTSKGLTAPGTIDAILGWPRGN